MRKPNLGDAAASIETQIVERLVELLAGVERLEMPALIGRGLKR